MVSSVTITKRGDQRLRNGHPWIYKSDIGRVEAAGGEIVAVIDSRGQRVGHALFSDRSEIALRMFSRGPEPPTLDTWRDRLRQAMAFRDGARHRRHRLPARARRSRSAALADRRPLRRLSGGPGPLAGDGSTAAGVDAAAGRDCRTGRRARPQRSAGAAARRARAAGRRAARDRARPGRGAGRARVRTRRISTRARRPGCSSISVRIARRPRDTRAAACSTRSATTAASRWRWRRRATRCWRSTSPRPRSSGSARTRARNGLTNVEARAMNVFDELRELERRGEAFDTIVLDPPAFAKNKAALPKALSGYKEINLRALKLLRPGGFLITCSCSYNVSEAAFAEVLAVGRPRRARRRRGRGKADAGARSPGADDGAGDLLPEVLHFEEAGIAAGSRFAGSRVRSRGFRGNRPPVSALVAPDHTVFTELRTREPRTATAAPGCYIPSRTMPKNAPALAPLTASDFTSAFPGSRKVYVDGPGGVRVPMREISLTNGEALRVYDTSGPQGCDVREGLPKLRAGWIAARAGGSGVTQLHFARQGVVTTEMEFVAIREGLDPEFVRSEDRPRPRHHPRERQSPRARADDHRAELRGEDQRQYRQLGGQLLDRRRGRQAALVDVVGRRYRDGSLDRPADPRDPRVDPAQCRGADRHRADLPGAREGRRQAGGSHLGGLPGHLDRTGGAGGRLFHGPRRGAAALHPDDRAPRHRHRVARRLDPGPLVPGASSGELHLHPLPRDLRDHARLRRVVLARRRAAARARSPMPTTRRSSPS